MLLILALLSLASSALSTTDHKEIGTRVTAQLKHLATFTDDPNPAVTRLIWTPNDLKARDYVKSLMKDAGLTISQDLLGNIYGTLEGADPKGPAIGTGSHIDAIPLAGMYDGTTGVLGGIEALRLLKESGLKPAVPIQVVMFTSEEPTRFGLSCLGSRAMAGVLTAADILKLQDVNGTGVIDAAIQGKCAQPGATAEQLLNSAKRTPKDLGAFVELHIEQGPELEAEGLNIGIVEAIAAPAQITVSFHGDGGHAGAHLMYRRNDASLAAAELALFVEETALGTKAVDTVATVGGWSIAPNAVNSVPRDAILDIDVRDIDLERRDGVLQAILDQAKVIAERRKVRYNTKIVSKDPPATGDATILDTIEHSAKTLNYSYKRMVSRAYHDSLFMAQISPTAMIFIPCEGGKSHRPDEFAAAEDIGRGVLLLAETLKELASRMGGSSVHDGAEL